MLLKKKSRKRFIFLEKVLEKLGCLPKRNIMNKKEFTEMFAHIDTLIIDVTEQRITHPSNEDIQADYYSGKKGVEQHPIAHTVKRLLITF